MQADFFDIIYGDLQGEVQIAQKDITKNAWFTWPEEREELLEYVERHSDTDLYCTTTTYSKRTRKAEYAEAGLVVYADADTCNPRNFRLRPTIEVRTSPGHWQAWWLLDAYEDADQIANVSKAVAYGHKDQGCDKSGWIPTKLLRVPGSVHSKTETIHEVTATFNGDLYSLEQIGVTYEDVKVENDVVLSVPLPDEDDLPDVFDVTGRMSMETWNLYNTDPGPGGELSDRMWRLELDMFREGFDAEEVFVAVWRSKINKYHPSRVGETTSSGSTRAARDNPQELLWKEVLHASTKWQEAPVEIEVEVDGTIVAPLTNAKVSFLTDDERDFVATQTTFVDRYVAWVASRTDASPEYSRTLGYFLLSSVLGNMAYLPTTFGNTKLNLWALILGETTLTRKSTAWSMCSSVIAEYEKQAEVKIDVGSDFSSEGLTKALGDRDNMVSMVWRDEIQGFFKEMFTKNYMAGTVERLTDLYGGRVAVSLRSTKGGSQNNRANVVFNLMGMGIEEETAEVLTTKNFRSGFLTRFLWCIADSPEVTRDKIEVTMRDESGYKGTDPKVIEFARELKAVTSRAPEHAEPIYWEDGTLERFNEWMWDTTQVAKKARNPKNMAPTVQRLGINILKCASLLALADRTPKVGLKHLLPVLKQAEEWYEALDRMSNAISASEFERQVNDVESYIMEGNGRRKMSTIHRKFGIRPAQINELVDALVMQGRVSREGQEVVVRGD